VISSHLSVVPLWRGPSRRARKRAAGLALSCRLAGQSARARGILEVFVQGLKEYGWIEGQSVSFEYRFAEGKADALATLAAELVQLRVDVILADGTPATNAARNATHTLPIVMAAVVDPVATGFVASLSRPGGNITGLSILAPELAGKRLQLLTETVPGLARVAVLANPSSLATPERLAEAMKQQTATSEVIRAQLRQKTPARSKNGSMLARI
jgi:putative tryptophan/tyrosine transport system substrate-binding protein